MIGKQVLVVDDSTMMRRVVRRAIGSLPSVVTVIEAGSGPEAVEQAIAHTPDAISLDLHLPGFDGIEVLRRVMRKVPTNVVMVSSHTGEGAALTLKCLEAGALDFVSKPSAEASSRAFELDMRRAIRQALRVGNSDAQKSSITETPKPKAGGNTAIVAVASSTGGPIALERLFGAMPDPLRVPMVVVQHMPEGFTASLAERLDEAGPMTVREAADGDQLKPGVALIAPGGFHMELVGGFVRLSDAKPVGRLRPRADITIEMAAREYGLGCLTIVLDGDGKRRS